ncbi:Lipase/serine esterase [Zostera marina]|uniref:Lipase/serine esterase n=1 Tax=Zostera marina TaxID=29655 RepID=A0A0K9PER0_ZOSMR|nr:Lipase/serine esterase [Zostera marina]
MESGDGQACTDRTVDQGTSVLNFSDSGTAKGNHLVVMVHGILGSTNDWKFAADQFVRVFSDKVIVHCSESNEYSLTLDGVDVMGERLADEVIKVINQKPGLQKISFIVHSVGGLVARYAIGRLYRPAKIKTSENLEGGQCDGRIIGTIYGLEAMNFITFATPHLGSRGNKQVPFLFGFPALEKLAAIVIHLIFRRTGRHLFLTDCDEGTLPLLLRMLGDFNDLFFISALRAFKRRVAYSNACYDNIVGWRTSSIRRNSELPELGNSISEKYPHIVREFFSKEMPIEENDQISMINCDPDQIEEEIVRGLSQVSWERIDVSFQDSKQRSAAHSIIQVKDEVVHSEGADVIQHMIDHFLT